MERVEALVNLHSRETATRGQGRPSQEMSDVLRGALVLAVAALDAVVLDCILEAIPPLASQGGLGDGVAKKLKSHQLLECFGREDPNQALLELCQEEYRSITFQTAKAIESNLNDILGCSAPWTQAAKRLSIAELRWEEKLLQGIAWEEATVTEQLDEYVKRRHRIAHDGDRTPNATRTSPIRRRYVADAAQFLREVGLAVHDVVELRVREAGSSGTSEG
jgi:hypothetical protein